jgi:hypothetical protein
MCLYMEVNLKNFSIFRLNQDANQFKIKLLNQKMKVLGFYLIL